MKVHRIIETITFVCLGFSLFCQTPALPFNLNGPPEGEEAIYVGIEGGIGTKQISDLSYLGIRGSIESKKYRTSLGIGVSINESGDNSFSINSDFHYVLLGQFNTLFEMLIQAGVGYNKISIAPEDSYNMINVPVGLGFGVNGPTPFVDVNLWGAIRGQLRHTSIETSENDIGVGFNIGISITPPGKRLGGYFAFDFLNIDMPFPTNNQNEIAYGLGIRYLVN